MNTPSSAVEKSSPKHRIFPFLAAMTALSAVSLFYPAVGTSALIANIGLLSGRFFLGVGSIENAGEMRTHLNELISAFNQLKMEMEESSEYKDKAFSELILKVSSLDVELKKVEKRLDDQDSSFDDLEEYIDGHIMSGLEALTSTILKTSQDLDELEKRVKKLEENNIDHEKIVEEVFKLCKESLLSRSDDLVLKRVNAILREIQQNSLGVLVDPKDNREIKTTLKSLHKAIEEDLTSSRSVDAFTPIPENEIEEQLTEMQFSFVKAIRSLLKSALPEREENEIIKSKRAVVYSSLADNHKERTMWSSPSDYGEQTSHLDAKSVTFYSSEKSDTIRLRSGTLLGVTRSDLMEKEPSVQVYKVDDSVIVFPNTDDHEDQKLMYFQREKNKKVEQKIAAHSKTLSEKFPIYKTFTTLAEEVDSQWDPHDETNNQYVLTLDRILSQKENWMPTYRIAPNNWVQSALKNGKEPRLQLTRVLSVECDDRAETQKLLQCEDIVGITNFALSEPKNADVKNSDLPVIKTLCESLAMNHITQLFLTDVCMSLEDVKTLANTPQLMNLTVLHLSNVGLTDEGMEVLTQSPFFCAARLTELKIDRNPLTASGIAALGKTPVLQHVSALNISGGHFDGKALALLNKYFPLQKLWHFFATGIAIDKKDIISFLENQEEFPDLQKVTLGYFEMSHYLYGALFKKANRLRSIDYSEDDQAETESLSRHDFSELFAVSTGPFLIRPRRHDQFTNTSHDFYDEDPVPLLGRNRPYIFAPKGHGKRFTEVERRARVVEVSLADTLELSDDASEIVTSERVPPALFSILQSTRQKVVLPPTEPDQESPPNWLFARVKNIAESVVMNLRQYYENQPDDPYLHQMFTSRDTPLEPPQKPAGQSYIVRINRSSFQKEMQRLGFTVEKKPKKAVRTGHFKIHRKHAERMSVQQKKQAASQRKEPMTFAFPGHLGTVDIDQLAYVIAISQQPKSRKNLDEEIKNRVLDYLMQDFE